MQVRMRVDKKSFKFAFVLPPLSRTFINSFWPSFLRDESGRTSMPLTVKQKRVCISHWHCIHSIRSTLYIAYHRCTWLYILNIFFKYIPFSVCTCLTSNEISWAQNTTCDLIFSQFVSSLSIFLRLFLSLFVAQLHSPR